MNSATDPRIKGHIEVAVRKFTHNTPDEILFRQVCELVYTAGQIAGVQQTIDLGRKVPT